MAKAMKKTNRRPKSPEQAEQEAMSKQVLAQMLEYDQDRAPMGMAPPPRMPGRGPSLHSTNASERAEASVRAESGDEGYGGDGSLAETVNRTIDEVDPSVLATMDDATEAFNTVGFSKPSPQLAKLWQTLPPEDRLAIFDAINNSAGMASDDQIAQEVGRGAATLPVGEEDLAREGILRTMGVR